eukprot:5620098-Pleurochrysis_carterae.AAC.1
MEDEQNEEGVIQMVKAKQAIKRPSRGQMDPDNKEKKDLALRQIISGIIPEWQEVNEKEKYSTILTMRL